MNRRQIELIEEIGKLEIELAENERIRRISGIEEHLHSHRTGTPADHSVSSAYAWIAVDISLRLEKLRAEYDRVADNRKLMTFGRDVHDFLKTEWSITHKTKLVDMGDIRKFGHTIAYSLPDEQESSWLIAPNAEIPDHTKLKVGYAEFREIGFGQRRIGYFAYAPEIDTIFVAK